MTKCREKPIYIKVREAILKSIENNDYKSMQKLPSETVLAKKYNVNRNTLRHALSFLKEEGIICSYKGKGHFISAIHVPYSISNTSSYTSEILDLGYEPKSEFLSCNVIEPTEMIAGKLDLKGKLKVIEIKLLRYVNDLPVAISYSYFDAFLYSKILENIQSGPFSLYKILHKSYPDLEIAKVYTIFESSLATKEQSKLLMIPTNTPLLFASTLSKNQYGNFVEYGTTCFRADICKIKVDL